MKTSLRRGRVAPKPTLSAAVLAGVLLVFVGATASAATGVSQGYTTKTSDITAGSVMGLSPATNTAEPATSDEAYQLLGLVADKPLIALSNGTNQVQIVISGPAIALVSDINGSIKAGDKIASSPIVGVGMKATDAGQIVGTAQVDFSKVQHIRQTVTDKSGKTHTVSVGALPLQVSVSYYSGTGVNQGILGSVLPPFVLQSANAIAGQPVSPLRVLIGLLALIIGFVIAGIMLQAAVRTGMISIGRNPLAKKAVRRELIDVSLTALSVMLIASIVVYMVLKI